MLCTRNSVIISLLTLLVAFRWSATVGMGAQSTLRCVTACLRLQTLSAYVINLMRRPDRRKNMRAVLGSLGVRGVTYLPGVDGSMLLEIRSGRA